jgi:hypothetical protein
VDATLEFLGRYPELGPRCRFRHSELGDELEQLLLEAIDSPRIPWEEANFDRVIASLREKHRAS